MQILISLNLEEQIENLLPFDILVMTSPNFRCLNLVS